MPNKAIYMLYELYFAHCNHFWLSNKTIFYCCITTQKSHYSCMKTLKTTHNETIRQELGKRLKSERLNQNITQAVLAKQAGISRRTLVGAERGEPFTIDTLLSILRALNRLEQIDLFLPEPEISPIQLSKLKGKKRQKASGTFTYPKPRNTPWVWKES